MKWQQENQGDVRLLPFVWEDTNGLHHVAKGSRALPVAGGLGAIRIIGLGAWDGYRVVKCGIRAFS